MSEGVPICVGRPWEPWFMKRRSERASVGALHSRTESVVNMGVMAWGHTLTHLQCTFVTSTEISVHLPRSLVNGELGMARTHFKTVTLGVIAVLFTYLFLVTQKTTHTPVS